MQQSWSDAAHGELIDGTTLAIDRSKTHGSWQWSPGLRSVSLFRV